MPRTGNAHWALVLAVVAPAARADVVIPVVGRPSPFYDAVGRTVTVEAAATPVELTADESIIFTLTVRNLLNPAAVRRPDLAEIDAFRRGFQADDEPPDSADPPGTRVFRYRLRVRDATTTEIPRVVFPFYDPDRPQPADRPGNPFRKAETRPIPIRVRPAGPPPLPPEPLDVSEFAEQLAPPGAPNVPAWGWWMAGVGPPILALIAYLAWRVVNPEGARLARRRRSRAARAVLHALHKLGRHPPVDLARVVGCVAGYVADRFDLPGVVRTPADVARRLREAGAPEALVADCERFFRAADAARFAPAGVPADGLIADADRLVRRLEGDA